MNVEVAPDYCFVCKNNVTRKSGKSVYIEFQQRRTVDFILQKWSHIRFCKDCWMEAAGEEFTIKGF